MSMSTIISRFKSLYRRGLSVAAIGTVMLVLMGQSVAIAAPSTPELAKAVAAIEALDQMRSTLASSLEGQPSIPTPETFKAVCKPVGMRAQQLSQENHWQVKQIATRYRNPAHAPDTVRSRLALAKFNQDSSLQGLWENTTLNGQPGVRYYRRINVEASCLACHGAREARPDFIKVNYPDDTAFDFNVGDLRGMYAVFIPDEVQQALQSSLEASPHGDSTPVL